MSQITTNIIQRVFHLKYGDAAGTCFAIDIEGRQYLITARHLVKSIDGADTIHIFHDNSWKDVPVTLVGHAGGETDISVLSLDLQIAPTHKVHIWGGGFAIAQDAYILGFPYRLQTDTEINNGYPIPLVKKGIFSGAGIKLNPIYLDVHNNPGFSGGPVVCENSDTKSVIQELRIVGVVSGYYKGQEVFDEGRRLESNSGITAVHGILHALDLIQRNPIGFPITKQSGSIV